MGLFTKVFGTYSQRELKSIYPIVDKITALEDEYKQLTDAELQAKTPEFKERLANGETLDDILPEAFAAVREAADRVLGMRPYPVQLVGGIVLHQGRIAEMKTGEGKTLVATLPAYLNALTGEGVHIVTVNDYLAKRDSEWMGKVHRFMGLTVGLIIHDMKKEERQKAYQADITYGTNNEMGFDYLRDNMALYANEQVQRGHAFAIVDEVDSILIDEARTPLIISGMGEKSTQLYDMAEMFAARLKKFVVVESDDKEEEATDIDADYVVDEKARSVTLTARGVKKAEEFFHLDNLSDPENSTIAHHINQAIKAHGIMKRDVDYVVKDGEVVIVDEFTGRLMFGRRYSEGLHQAIEAKEHLSVQRESKTLATITFQNYFRLYRKLSGMTGTALTEEEEFATIYALDIIEIPTNRPITRIDNEDSVYKTENGKYRAVIQQVKACHAKGQPVLVGTVSIEKNELLGKMLTREGIKHNLLNAKNHEREAEIVAQAGQFGAVTVATNMAGRGTDIKLSDSVKAAGGLAIIGTERHESRRVDRQLRGRSGRQGDPGSSVFFVSFEDQLMRLFATDRVMKMLDRLGLHDGEMIESKMVTNAIEKAQKRVEENNFGIRKRLLEYDDVMNKQRTYIYARRHHALLGERVGIDIANMLYDTIENIINNYPEADYFEDMRLELMRVLAIEPPFTEDEFRNMEREDAINALYTAATQALDRKGERIIEMATPVIKDWVENRNAKGLIIVPITDGKRVYQIRVDINKAYDTDCKQIVKEWHKTILLICIDELWKEHLRELDQLRQSVQNASYEQKDPLVIYKVESFHIFERMLSVLNNKAMSSLLRGQIYIPKRETPAEGEGENANQAPERKAPEVRQAMPERTNPNSNLKATKDELPGEAERRAGVNASQAQKSRPEPVKVGPKVGRNDPCPCGSGKKFKNCHGRNENI